MTKHDKNTDISDVPNKIFESFLEELSNSEISKEVVERLRYAISGKSQLSDRAIKKAILPDES